MADDAELILNEYKKLKGEFDEYKGIYLINNKLACSEEYEKELENTNKELLEENEKLKKELNKIKEDHLKNKERNDEKNKDIEYLEKANDKLKKEMDGYKEEKLKNDKRLVILENENSDYLNKIR
jgi:hypothetical protein